MASAHRNESVDLGLLASLAEEPYSYGFFEALRQLECLYGASPRLGRSSRPGDDAFRLGQTPTMQFAPSTLAEFVSSTDAPPLLKVFFFGLYGPNGPLPLHLTEQTRNRIRDAKDSTLADFADMFHHRLLCLFYRAWADKEPSVHLDRPEQDRFAWYVGSLAGLGLTSLRKRDSIPDHVKLHFAGHLGLHTKHSKGLASLLKEFFQVPVKIQEFIGEWLEIPKDSYCYLDGRYGVGQLGVSAVIGVSSWQCQHKFRITIGPLTLVEYESFLPAGRKLNPIFDLVNNYVGFEFKLDLNLILKKHEVPSVQLGKYGRLGWTTWLKTGTRINDANDLYLNREKIT
jgi:type VI secretion system protein ImpH